MSDYISEDDLVLILKLLPVKTLLRFRSVSKWWKQLIDSPAFVKEHLSVQKPRFIVEYGLKYTVVDPRPRPLVHTMSKPIGKKKSILVGTLHGVVCLYEIYRDFVIWKPAIHKFSILPSDFIWDYRGGVRYSFGFWIDSLSREFKIIILQRQLKDDLRNYQFNTVVDCILYSSLRCNWSVIPSGKLGNWKSCKEGPPVIIGEVAYWGGCLEDSIEECNNDHSHEDKVILSFDFAQESFDLIKMPDLTNYRTAPCRWQGALSLVCWDIHYPRGCMIYLRQEDSWVKTFGFQFYDNVKHIFWAMEDMEIRTENRKRKWEMEDRVSDSPGVAKGHVRVLATTVRELLFDGTKSGTKIVRRGLIGQSKVNVAYDFVESLLFP